MQILYFIGNGFDLNLGFKTKYADFLAKYLNIPSPSKVIQDGKRFIQQEMQAGIDTWADMEISLGKLSEHYNGDNAQAEFLELYNDIITELSKYLKQQVALADYKKYIDEVCKSIALLLMKPEQYLEEIPMKIVTNAKSRLANEQHLFYFVNFNYTNIFDRCLQGYKANGGKLTHMFRTNEIKDSIGNLIHIHGTVDKCMILGVNDDTQIMNQGFHDDAFHSRFVKPQINTAIDKSNDTQTSDLINSSALIVIYGMSLGASDKKWWIQIAHWLVEDDKRHLIIFVRDNDFSPVLPCAYLDAVGRVRERFVGYSPDGQIDVTCMKRIHVAINADVFPFKLVNPDEVIT